MTKEDIRFQVAVSCIQGILEAKHGVIGEVVPALAVGESLRIADEFVKQWFGKTEGQKVERAIKKGFNEKDKKIKEELSLFLTRSEGLLCTKEQTERFIEWLDEIEKGPNNELTPTNEEIEMLDRLFKVRKVSLNDKNILLGLINKLKKNTNRF